MIDLQTIFIIGVFLAWLIILVSTDSKDILDTVRLDTTWNVAFIIGAVALYCMYMLNILSVLSYLIVFATIFDVSYCSTCLVMRPKSQFFKVASRRYAR